MSRAISKRLTCIEPGTLFVGVDLSLDDSVAVVLDGQARRLDQFRLPYPRFLALCQRTDVG